MFLGNNRYRVGKIIVAAAIGGALCAAAKGASVRLTWSAPPAHEPRLAVRLEVTGMGPDSFIMLQSPAALPTRVALPTGACDAIVPLIALDSYPAPLTGRGPDGVPLAQLPADAAAAVDLSQWLSQKLLATAIPPQPAGWAASTRHSIALLAATWIILVLILPARRRWLMAHGVLALCLMGGLIYWRGHIPPTLQSYPIRGGGQLLALSHPDAAQTFLAAPAPTYPLFAAAEPDHRLILRCGDDGRIIGWQVKLQANTPRYFYQP